MTLLPVRERHLLLIVATPTPNGRLHLGHMGGPLLKMDAIARHFRQNGSRAFLLSGSDPYDSYTLLRAHHYGVTPEAVSARFHALFEADLRTLDIAFDAFVNPLDPKWSVRYTGAIQTLVGAMIERGRTYRRLESFPYCPDLDDFLPRSFLLGTCRRCSADIAGLICEDCGEHHLPSEVRNKRSRVPTHRLEERPVDTLFAAVDRDALAEAVGRVDVGERLRAVATQFLERPETAIRLTVPSRRWGVPSVCDGQVYDNYATQYLYCVMLGDVHRELAGEALNPFHEGSGVTTAVSFGFDNVVTFLIDGIGCSIAHGSLKSFDHYLTNHFLNLEGEKFSTSRNHVLLVDDVVGHAGAASDAVRAYLLWDNADEASRNITRDGLLQFGRRLAHGLRGSVLDALVDLGGLAPDSPPDAVLNEFDYALRVKNRGLDPATYDGRAVVEMLLATLARREHAGRRDGNGAYWRTKATAFLLFPVMPKIGQRLWQALGHAGAPTIGAFLERRVPLASGEAIAVEEADQIEAGLRR